MEPQTLIAILDAVKAGRKSVLEAVEDLRFLPYADLIIAKHDTHRALRNGFSEVLFCEGKHPDHLLTIVQEMVNRNQNIFGTRLVPAMARTLQQRFPAISYDAVSQTFQLQVKPIPPLSCSLGILSAGTADLPVAEEAHRTAAYFGVEAKRFYDVGVAGLHRLFDSFSELHTLDAAIVVAGMEGALPSVVGGLIGAPIIAVPSSVGYGTSFKGLTALLAMLNSCAEGVTVVNIDNGFGAACAAMRIVRRMRRTDEKKREPT